MQIPSKLMGDSLPDILNTKEDEEDTLSFLLIENQIKK
jgi:hypothetical protein